MAKKRDRDDVRPTGPVARNDAYVMMLFITFVAIVTGCVLMYMDFDQYGKTAPPPFPAPAITGLGTSGVAPAAVAPEAPKGG